MKINESTKRRLQELACIKENWSEEDFQYWNEVGEGALGPQNKEQSMKFFTQKKQTKSFDRIPDITKRMASQFVVMQFFIIQDNGDGKTCTEFHLDYTTQKPVSSILPYSFDTFLRTAKKPQEIRELTTPEMKRQVIKKDLKLVL